MNKIENMHVTKDKFNFSIPTRLRENVIRQKENKKKKSRLKRK